MEKDFDGWNKAKKRLDSSDRDGGPFAKRGWVWMCSVGINIGSEQNGGRNFGRPVLVVRKLSNQMYWVVPLSSQQRPFDFYYNFTDPDGNAVSAILAQLKLMSIKRFDRRMYEMSHDDFNNIITRLQGYLQKSEPRTGRGSSEPPETEGALPKKDI